MQFLHGHLCDSLCAPSLAAMLTGKHSFKNDKVDNVQAFDWNQETFPKLLQQNGYQTALIQWYRLVKNYLVSLVRIIWMLQDYRLFLCPCFGIKLFLHSKI